MNTEITQENIWHINQILKITKWKKSKVTKDGLVITRKGLFSKETIHITSIVKQDITEEIIRLKLKTYENKERLTKDLRTKILSNVVTLIIKGELNKMIEFLYSIYINPYPLETYIVVKNNLYAIQENEINKDDSEIDIYIETMKNETEQ